MKDKITDGFARSLFRLRTQRGWTQALVAAMIGCPPGTVNNWENGHRNVTLYYLTRLADLFGVALDEMAGR